MNSLSFGAPATALVANTTSQREQLRQQRIATATRFGNLPTGDAFTFSINAQDKSFETLSFNDASASPCNIGASHPLVQSPLLAGNGIRFAGSFSNLPPHIALESSFINTLKTSKDLDEQISLADILGRAKSINAQPTLRTLTTDQTDIRLRTVAVRSLGLLGESMHPNSHTRSLLNTQMLSLYEKRKGELWDLLKTPAKPEELAQKLNNKEQNENRLNELRALATAIQRINVPGGQTVLRREYTQILGKNQKAGEEQRQLQQAITEGKKALHELLEKKYNKPIKQILEEIPEPELKKLQAEVKVKLNDDTEITLADALEKLPGNPEQQAMETELLDSLTDELARHNTGESDATLKLGLHNGKPELRAKTLRELAGRANLHYGQDIYPNLGSSNVNMREAALTALVASTEHNARLKVLELLRPQAFFDILGGVGRGSMETYLEFIQNIAERGDQFINGLGQRAVGGDFNQETRMMSLATLGVMLDESNIGNLSKPTIEKARHVLQSVALAKVPVREDKDRAVLSTTALKLWIAQNDPKALELAIQSGTDTNNNLTDSQRESLLLTVAQTLHTDGIRQESGKKDAKSALSNAVLDVLHSSSEGEWRPILDKNNEAMLRALWPQKTAAVLQDPSTYVETVTDCDTEKNASASISPEPHKALARALSGKLDALRPGLLKTINSPQQSIPSFLAAFRILGLLQDKESVPQMIERLQDPLKGRIDWKKEPSYIGSPTQQAKNIRANLLVALGDSRDARALEPLTAALDEPELQRVALDPLRKIASAANTSAPPEALEKTRKQLHALLAADNTSRAYRGFRIQAAHTLFHFKNGPETIRDFAMWSKNPDYKRHALSAWVANDYATKPDHPDHHLLSGLLTPGLGVERLHARNINGEGMELSIVDGGYINAGNHEGFQNRVVMPPSALEPKGSHPSMVMSTAAGDGPFKGVAPKATVYSDQWPTFNSEDPWEGYKKIIEGKLRGENNIRVINNSWGFSSQDIVVLKDIRKILKSFKQVVDLAEKAGIQIVFAAGNEGESSGVPHLGSLTLFGVDIDKLSGTDAEKEKAQADLNYILHKVVVVGATNTRGTEDRSQHEMAAFSSYGDSLQPRLKPTVVAPGADMMVYGWDKLKGRTKELVNGTSFASPFVSGLLLLLFKVNPNLTPSQARSILQNSAIKLDNVPDYKQGAGQVSPEGAVREAEALALAEKLTRKRKRVSKEVEATLPLTVSPVVPDGDGDSPMTDSPTSISPPNGPGKLSLLNPLKRKRSEDSLTSTVNTERHSKTRKLWESA